MGRTVCVYYPDWSLRGPDVPAGRPCLVVDDGVVVAVDRQTAEVGVTVGMRRGDAEVRCPNVVTLERDAVAEARAFEPVVVAVEAVVPRVEVAEPGMAFVPIAGAVRYYGGESAVLAAIVAAAERVASGGWYGLAGGPFAARWCATSAPGRIVDDDLAFLSGLDVDVLGMDDLAATFRWLGVDTLGELARLPRQAMLTRFGRLGWDAHRLASGEDRAPDPRPIPEGFAVEGRYEEPLVAVDQIGFAARALARDLVEHLAREGVAAHRIEIAVEAADGTERSRVWRSADPFTEVALAERVWWQLRAWIESAGVPGGVVRLCLDPTDLSGRGRQGALLEDAAAMVETERALARAQTLVGEDDVLTARPWPGRDPGRQVRWIRWGEDPPASTGDVSWHGAVPTPLPSLVAPKPQPVEIEWDAGTPMRIRLRSRWETVLSWAGPWRDTRRWWNGEPAVSRYQIVTSVGALLCEVRDGQGFVAGVYD